jgi:phosphoglycerol transferase MdoB-like AlkP superfamily enzyme
MIDRNQGPPGDDRPEDAAEKEKSPACDRQSNRDGAESRTLMSSLLGRRILGRIQVKAALIHALVLLVYIGALKKFDSVSAFGYSERRSLLLEAPLAILIYYAFFSIFKKGKLRYVSAGLPVLLYYGIFDIYYRAFGSMFKFVAAKQLPELLATLNPAGSFAIIAGFIAVIGLLAYHSDFRAARKEMAVVGALLGLGVLVLEFSPSWYLSSMRQLDMTVVPAPDTANVTNNGRMVMTLYWEAKRSAAVRSLKSHLNSPEFRGYIDRTIGYLRQSPRKSNVHLVILESFFDPSLLSNVKLSKSPLHPRFTKLFGERGGLSMSPVFGGRSAQAEFEVLCGVPAFAEFDDIEFKVFGGGQIWSLPKVLEAAGYRTMVTNAFKPFVFNADVAYRGLRFQNVSFPKEYAAGRDTYFIRGELQKNEDFMFDGDLLQKNLTKVRSLISKNPGQPLFNYVVSLYGHYPFWIDFAKRPRIIEVQAPPVVDADMLERLVNQIYYRTEAIAEYVEGLEAIDPDSLIIFVGDHLPNLERMAEMKHGKDAYRLLGYLGGREDGYKYSAIYALWRGKPVEVGKMGHFDIYEMILNYLTNNEYCKREGCFGDREKYHQRYIDIMAQAVGQ